MRLRPPFIKKEERRTTKKNGTHTPSALGVLLLIKLTGLTTTTTKGLFVLARLQMRAGDKYKWDFDEKLAVAVAWGVVCLCCW